MSYFDLHGNFFISSSSFTDSSTIAGGYSTSNLTLILALGFCPVQMPDSDNDHLMEKLQF